eukprot:TRINITY_DN11578_c0_g2_i1.p1 TRINITY_DN11578_c0_g2~~TRINITY_DN11578_c0_g2_i1.p1  ORF type:complete len:259 (-),score=61.79 TRINITY_DN11578_c0_g2_i1:319-1047(-)
MCIRDRSEGKSVNIPNIANLQTFDPAKLPFDLSKLPIDSNQLDPAKLSQLAAQFTQATGSKPNTEAKPAPTSQGQNAQNDNNNNNNNDNENVDVTSSRFEKYNPVDFNYDDEEEDLESDRTRRESYILWVVGWTVLFSMAVLFIICCIRRCMKRASAGSPDTSQVGGRQQLDNMYRPMSIASQLGAGNQLPIVAGASSVGSGNNMTGGQIPVIVDGSSPSKKISALANDDGVNDTDSSLQYD